MSQDPYTDHNNQPQNPYQYGTPQNPYQAPQGPYTTPPPYGHGQQQQSYEYGQQQQSYAYPPPQATPLPLEQAIKDLPSQYIKVLTKPSADTFAQEMGKASWNIVWAQLIGYAVVSAILSYIVSLIMPNPFSTMGSTTSNPIMIQLIHWGFTLGLTPVIIISFFIGTGIRYLIAKAFRGQGTFLAQGYTDLLFSVPLSILSILVSWVPLLSGLVAFGVFVYGIVLRIFSIMAVHRLSGGKATAVVLLPIAVVILLIALLAVAIIAMIVAAGAIH
ncbi:MAG TPA: YIP1 family protein [Ktedonobacteraceae bacterium]|nr:YIP1 family protein [Ktedonobacteraceae bacterium]